MQTQTQEYSRRELSVLVKAAVSALWCMLTRICVHKCYFPRLFPRPLGGNGGERCKIWNQWSWIDSRKWVPCYKSRGRQKSGPLKSAHTYLKTCEYGTFHGKKDTANISKLRILRWGVYPGLPGAGGHNKQVSKEREEGKSISNPMDCSPSGSSARGIFQARILEWVAISFSRGSSWPRHRIHVSCIGRQILYHWATWEVQW